MVSPVLGVALWGLWILRSLYQSLGGVQHGPGACGVQQGWAGTNKAHAGLGDVESQTGRSCVTVIQGGYFGDQQPGQWVIQDMETRVCVCSCSPCFTLHYFHPWGLEVV